MATILECIDRVNRPPTWRVKCRTCGRVYQTTSWPGQLQKQVYCHACSPRRNQHLQVKDPTDVPRLHCPNCGVEVPT